MPTKYRPTYRLEVLYNDEDWEDITGFVDTWTIEYGSDLSLDRYGIPVTTASGTITLDNNGLYDPDSENKKFTSEQLVRRNEFRLWADEIIEFQGFVTAPDVITSEVDPIISYTVESRHKPTLQFNSNELNTEPTTMAGLARSFTEVTGIPLNSSSDQPVGNVFFRGRWLDFLDDYARYGGGFVLEDNRGSFNYRNYREAVEFAETAGLGFDYEPFAEDFHTRKTSEQVLNHVECSGFGYLNPVTEVVARASTTTVYVPSGFALCELIVNALFDTVANVQDANLLSLVALNLNVTFLISPVPNGNVALATTCLLYTSPSPRDS